MKLKIALAAGLLLISCMALAQQDTKDKPGEDTKASKPDKPKAGSSDDKKATKSDKTGTNLRDLVQEFSPDDQGIPVLKDIPIVGNLFQVDNDAQNQALSMLWTDTSGPEMDKRVSLDVNDMPVKDALKSLFDQVKLTFEAEKDVPNDARVTLKLNNVRFATALSAICEAADIGWQRQYTVKDKKVNTTFKVGKKLKSNPGVFQWSNGLPNNIFQFRNGQNGALTFPDSKALRQYLNVKPGQNGVLTLPDSNLWRQYLNVQPGNKIVIPRGQQKPLTLDNTPNGVYNLLTQEDRHTFTCPHCKQQVTIVGKRQAPKCEKCGRTFQSNWDFCPYDGAKRPANADTWQFCPHCGKRVTP